MALGKLIVVIGATGNQGGSVADTFLSTPGWRVRALTRNTSSTKAQALAARGAEVVRADMDEPLTLEQAFEGANAIFAVSDFWGLFGDPANQGKAKPGQAFNAWVAEYETQQLKNVIDAAAKVPTLERFVLSSLSNATKWSKGKYTHVYHFDSKAKAEDYGRETYPDLWAKTSVYQAGWFLSNYITSPLMKPSKDENGVVKFIGNLDLDIKFPFVAAEEDSGPITKALVQEPAGKNIIGYREWLTLREFAAVFTQATGLEAEAVRLPRGQLPFEVPPELQAELNDNWDYWNECGYEGRDDPTIIHPKDLASPPKLGTVFEYIKKQDWTKILG
ncbi:hypothetical protein TARUN_9682 [Trichoderma arundinaceum]|uniref:NmrA-like domain-containing protein n=1 Tax=Trichoderma arundinaceum TaxID=490622 RepID=A0A395N9U1_TRIAR|nr:hypothetical protein TARUN_9682 [Trichoderma arundinaceum]